MSARDKRKKMQKSQTLEVTNKRESVRSMTRLIPKEYNPTEFYKAFRDTAKMNKSEMRSLKKQK